jgi:hypothetical protein
MKRRIRGPHSRSASFGGPENVQAHQRGRWTSAGVTAFKKENEARGLVFPSCAARLKTARPSRMPGTGFVAVTGRGARATAAYSLQFIDGQITYDVSFHCRVGRRVTHRGHHFSLLLSQFPDNSTKSNDSLPPMQTSLWTNGRAWRRAGCLRRIGIITGAFSALACPSTTAADAVQLIGCQTTHARRRHVVDAQSVNELTHHVRPLLLNVAHSTSHTHKV